MKILLVSEHKLDSEYGGGQVYVKNLVACLLANQHDVSYMSIAFADISLSQRLWTSCTNIKELQLIMPANWQREYNSAGNGHITDEIMSVFKELRPDVIHAHGFKEYACVGAKRCGVPCVVTVHHGGIVCPAGALLTQHDKICNIPANRYTCLPCCVRDIRGGKLWLPLLRMIPHDVQLRLGRWLRTRKFLYFITPLGTLALSIRDKLAAIKILGTYATLLIAPSLAIRDALIRSGIFANKIVVVPHGIPLPQQQPIRRDLKKVPVRFLYVGRISYVKGVHVMLKAFSGLPLDAYELHIVGGAVTKPERRYLAKLQRRYASVNIIWHGARSHEEIPQHIASCDVLVHPAIFLEVFGLTIAEALAVGRPVIASCCGGAEMQIHDGKNGLLVPSNDPAALTNKVEYLLHNPAEILRLASNTQPVRSIEEHVQDLLSIYREVI